MESINQYLERIEDLLDSGGTVPFSNRVMVDKEEIFELITDIRLKLPNEIKQSQWVLEERSKILIEAQKEADDMVKDTEKQIQKLVNEHEISKKAYEKSEELIENAKKISREMRLGSYEYADEVIQKVEERIQETMTAVHSQYKELEEFMIHQLETLRENRIQLNVQKAEKSSEE